MKGPAMADRRALIKQFNAAWSARDVDVVMNLMADDCEFHTSIGPSPGTSYIGREAVARAFRAFLEPPPDPYTVAGPVWLMVAEDFCVTRWSSRTARPGDDLIVTSACDIFLFAGDKIMSKDTYRKVTGSAPC
jgi:uncharacterized protein (TIGR02246 family)